MLSNTMPQYKTRSLNPLLSRFSNDLNANLEFQETYDIYKTAVHAAVTVRRSTTRVERTWDEYKAISTEIATISSNSLLQSALQHEIDRNHMSAAALTLAKVLNCDVSLLLTGHDIRYNPLFPPQGRGTGDFDPVSRASNLTLGHNLIAILAH
jgi:hypothetical protein